MADTKFIAYSKSSQEALKTANLLQSLHVNVFIYGEAGVGKKTLARVILPKAPIIDGKNYEELLSVLQSSNEIIISHIENVANIKVVLEKAQKNNVRIVATSYELKKESLIEKFFSIQVPLLPLSQRKEDLEALCDIFIEEIEHILGEKINFDRSNFIPDLSKNSISLKKQLFIEAVFGEIEEKELMQILYRYLYDKLGSNDDYKKFIHLYEVPLIQAGLHRFKSQLQLADKLGLNRNTLRKKISQHKEYLE